MLYKDLTLGGDVANYKPENELARFKVKATNLGNKVETFTINVNDITATTATIEMIWENTKVGLNIVADIDAKVMKNIETALSPADKRPYYSAASYYYDNNKDMKQALEWISKAAEMNPKAYWVFHLKAKIQLKLKDIDGAIKTAEQSILLAKEDKDDAYVKNNEKLIAEAKKMK
jgi:tetratricopeptide (TPR) repeat protein